MSAKDSLVLAGEYTLTLEAVVKDINGDATEMEYKVSITLTVLNPCLSPEYVKIELAGTLGD